MEQKTEASQAVDLPFPPMPLPVVKHAVVGDLFDRFAMQQYAMRYADLVVAALKAQPAPTEAQGGKLLELFKLAIGTIAVHDQAEAERIAKMYRLDMGIPSSAQGEDSARLEWLRRNSSIGDGIANLQATPRKVRVVRFPVIEGESLNEAIDRARASAETGGVTP